MTNDICSICFKPVGTGIADRTLDIYNEIVCVECAVAWDLQKPRMIEVNDGLLISSPNAYIVKAKNQELLPENLKTYFNDKDLVKNNQIKIGLDKVVVKCQDKQAVYDSKLFYYVKSHGKASFYLSNIPLPLEEKTYPLFAKCKSGWICLSPLEVG